VKKLIILLTSFFSFINYLFPDEATIKISPDSLVCGSYQTIEIKFFTNNLNIDSGGGFRFELPIGYLETKPYYWDKPQTDLIDGRGFVSTDEKNKNNVKIGLYGARGGIINCEFLNNINSNDTIRIFYSGTVQSLAWDLRINAQWRQNKYSEWKKFKTLPKIKFSSQNMKNMLVNIPSDCEKNKPINIKVAAIDKYGNRVKNFDKTIILKSQNEINNKTIKYNFTREDSGFHQFKNYSFLETGFQKIILIIDNDHFTSNYIFVHNSVNTKNKYFGDLHFHTGTGEGNKMFSSTFMGGDHRGNFSIAQSAYKYAKKTMLLDFASSTEHDTKYFTENGWEISKSVSESNYSPNEFTTFFGYEWTAASDIGHHIILFKDINNIVYNHFDYSTKESLWKIFDKNQTEVLMIPHVTWTQESHGIWTISNNRYRRVGEIYSLWNNRYLIQPGDEPDRFELGVNSPWSYQFAWAKGNKIGLIGCSDNHTGHPGLNNYSPDCVHSGGLTAILSSKNNRNHLWDGLYNRNTYATTGTRIYLDFQSDGNLMGTEYICSSLPNIFVRAGGTNIIDKIDIIKFDYQDFKIIYSNTPESDTITFNFVDSSYQDSAMYYIKIKQIDESWKGPWSHNKAEMAWSSPIWIKSK
tara:strand:+ start:1920 stop:3830 length:1911 start_codon:yes stop_codon:yes gene_type:complete